MQPTSELNFLTPKQYEEYTAAWVAFIQEASADEVQRLFQAPGMARLCFVSLSMPQLVWLLSTVGVRRIQARFVLQPQFDMQPRFSVALYGTDAAGTRLSAYYLAGATWATKQPPLHDGEVPQELAEIWLRNWIEAEPLTRALFATSYGPLQGYSFELRDFLDPLFAPESLNSQALRAHFGLHAYYPATDSHEPPALTQTFGLVLRLHTPGTEAAAAPVYDMATPIPPG